MKFSGVLLFMAMASLAAAFVITSHRDSLLPSTVQTKSNFGIPPINLNKACYVKEGRCAKLQKLWDTCSVRGTVSSDYIEKCVCDTEDFALIQHDCFTCATGDPPRFPSSSNFTDLSSRGFLEQLIVQQYSDFCGNYWSGVLGTANVTQWETRLYVARVDVGVVFPNGTEVKSEKIGRAIGFPAPFTSTTTSTIISSSTTVLDTTITTSTTVTLSIKTGFSTSSLSSTTTSVVASQPMQSTPHVISSKSSQSITLVPDSTPILLSKSTSTSISPSSTISSSDSITTTSTVTNTSTDTIYITATVVSMSTTSAEEMISVPPATASIGVPLGTTMTSNDVITASSSLSEVCSTITSHYPVTSTIRISYNTAATVVIFQSNTTVFAPVCTSSTTTVYVIGNTTMDSGDSSSLNDAVSATSMGTAPTYANSTVAPSTISPSSSPTESSTLRISPFIKFNGTVTVADGASMLGSSMMAAAGLMLILPLLI